eukprot:Opistho-1_new@63056
MGCVSRHFRTSAIACGQVVQFKLADIGEGIAEAEVLQWFVKEGDKVTEFQKLCEVQSDKATVEITSRYNGTVQKLHHKRNDMAKVGAPLVDIELEGGDAAAEAAPKQVQEQKAASAAPTQQSPSHAGETSAAAAGDKVLTTPAVRRIAKENAVDLARVRGTGRDGRILKEDIVAYVEGRATVPATPLRTQEPRAAPATASSEAPRAPPAPQPYVPGQSRTEPIRGFKRTMVKTMTAANQVPHFGYCDEIVMNALVDLRERLKPAAEARGARLSFMPFFIKAASLALRQFPVLNASVNADCSEITYHGDHNIGVAMDTPNGLVVPNIKRCQSLSIFEIASELNRLQAAGAKGQLGAADLTGGTFTLSNIGTVGGTYTKPVIVLPEVAIGALGRMQSLPRFKEDGATVYAAKVVCVSWSADHRVIDGVTMAKFSNAWIGYLENPTSMILDMK